MTGHDDFDRTVAGWFEADALAPAPADGLDLVLDATRRHRPRPTWLAGPGSHWVGEVHDAGSNSGTRSLPRVGVRWSTALILLLVVAALVGGAILVGARLFQPSPIPAGRLGHLVYGLDGDIFVADWDGRNPVRIADGVADPGGGGPAGCGTFWGEGPMWSPDGRHLAYRSGGDGCPGIVYVSDPAGHPVASFPGTGWLVSWSPDSRRVATWVDLDTTIGIYGLDGARQALLTLPPGFAVEGDYDPLWSPDGRSLLIRLAPPRPSEVWELPVDGGTPRPVPTDDPRSHWGATFSRDGARVVYNEAGNVVVADADGTQRRLLAESGNRPSSGSILWSPTGDRVAFTWSYDALGTLKNLRVMEMASGNALELTSSSEIGPIHFSPEGDRILFWKTDHNDVPSLWSVDVHGSDSQLLVSGTSWGDWQWQPAGP